MFFGAKKIKVTNFNEIKGISVSISDISQKKPIENLENSNQIIEKPKIEEVKKEEKKKEIKKEEKPKPKPEVKINKKEVQKPVLKPKKEEEKPKIEEPKKEEIKKIQEVPAQKIEEIIDVAENINDLNLSQREKFNIKSQLNSCFQRVFADSEILEIEIILQVSKDGMMFFDEKRNISSSENDENYQKQVAKIKKTIELCNPLRNLSQEKYEVWREFRVKFKK